MASNQDTRGEAGVEEAPGVPQDKGKGAAPGDERASERKDEASLPEHRSIGSRRDLGEGDIDASAHEDGMSRKPSRS